MDRRGVKGRLNMDLEQRKNKLKKKFRDLFLQENTDYFSSSGRIELLGNHTDHNHGSVIVGAVNLDILAATRKREDRKVVIYSKGYPKIALQIDDLELKEEESGKSIAIVRAFCTVFWNSVIASADFPAIWNLRSMPARACLLPPPMSV